MKIYVITSGQYSDYSISGATTDKEQAEAWIKKRYEKLKKYRPMFNKDGRKLRVYILTNFDTTHKQDLERIYKLKELDYDPYVMIYDKPNAPKITRKLQRYVNNKFIFRSCNNFEEYQLERK